MKAAKPPQATSAPALEPLGVLALAQDSFGVPPNAPANEWPFNLLSQNAVRFTGGRIGRPGDVLAAADPAEQKRCDDLSAKAAAEVNKQADRPATAVIEPFRLPVLPGEPASRGVTHELLRHRFGGTLHPWATVTVTPFADTKSRDLSALFFGINAPSPTAHNPPWQAVRDWFKGQSDLAKGVWVVEVNGVGAMGCQAVRLMVARTKAGSLVGFVTVGLIRTMAPDQWPSAIRPPRTPAQIYKQLIALEREPFAGWLNEVTGRTTARVILRAFPHADLKAWHERTQRAFDRSQAKHFPAIWRSEFHKLTAARELVLPPAWEAVLRCTTGGRWDVEWRHAPRPYHDHWTPFSDDEREPEADGFFLYEPDAVRATSERLAPLDEAWLKGKYADLRATDYAPFVSEADWETVAAVFRQTAEFYAEATADGLAVVTEITARTDAEIAAETADPVPPKVVPKPKEGVCAADADMLAPLEPCMEPAGQHKGRLRHDLSRQVVRFTCGRLGQPGDDGRHEHPKGEVDRVRELAGEAEQRLAGCVPDYDQRGPFLAFFAAATLGDEVPAAFTERFVRQVLFNGTINPECGVSIGPITAGELWYDGSAAAAEFVTWFTSRPGLHGHAFISIGLDEDEGGAMHPRLAVAFTDKGSVVGVCGYVVWA